MPGGIEAGSLDGDSAACSLEAWGADSLDAGGNGSLGSLEARGADSLDACGNGSLVVLAASMLMARMMRVGMLRWGWQLGCRWQWKVGSVGSLGVGSKDDESGDEDVDECWSRAWRSSADISFLRT